MITMAGWVLQILIMASSAHDAESSHLILMSDGPYPTLERCLEEAAEQAKHPDVRLVHCAKVSTVSTGGHE